ncbi:hypothetical protein HCN51_57170 [Nonomuraea sp. FMUSA5-5]|uniref:Uncharacterized protein n=1 Tax=Nonomuraea composti TaxID=2720023 RepID=A0ABX1BQV8_9ACTN|nr:hypothetical protein [Nonomuraea sp. FMUSA5-5]NJP98857.1 hypothetical protein [Nonomuraea sp. FMUSA5-5]
MCRLRDEVVSEVLAGEGSFPELRLGVPPEEIAYTPSWITEGPLALPVILGVTSR